jgi:hypothetical protein
MVVEHICTVQGAATVREKFYTVELPYHADDTWQDIGRF